MSLRSYSRKWSILSLSRDPLFRKFSLTSGFYRIMRRMKSVIVVGALGTLMIAKARITWTGIDPLVELLVPNP